MYKRQITDDELGAASLDGVLSADRLARFIPGLFALKEKMPKKGRLAYKLLPEEVKAELDAFIDSLKTDCKYIGDLVKEYADAKCQLSMLYEADPAHVEEQRQKDVYKRQGFQCAVHVPHLNDFNTDLVAMRAGLSVEDLDRQRMAELEAAFEQDAGEEPEHGMEV